MEKPLALKILSIITILFGLIRIIAGVAGFTLTAGYLNNDTIITHVMMEYLVVGPLVLISGILLFSGKKLGRLLLIISSIIGIIGNVFNFGILKSVLPLIVILVLSYVIPSINEYFSKNKRVSNI